MSGNVEIDTWEPARLPVAITELSTLFNGYPSSYWLKRWGRCWAAEEVDVRWDADIWTTHWFVDGCRDRKRVSGNVAIAEVQGQYWNDDFPLNTSRVWVTHLARMNHDDASGRIWYQGWAGVAGGVGASMLASGINIANSCANSNCNLRGGRLCCVASQSC